MKKEIEHVKWYPINSVSSEIILQKMPPFPKTFLNLGEMGAYLGEMREFPEVPQLGIK